MLIMKFTVSRISLGLGMRQSSMKLIFQCDNFGVIIQLAAWRLQLESKIGYDCFLLKCLTFVTDNRSNCNNHKPVNFNSYITENEKKSKQKYIHFQLINWLNLQIQYWLIESALVLIANMFICNAVFDLKCRWPRPTKYIIFTARTN